MGNVVQCSILGSDIGIGNKLFQYAFARSYAESIGAELQTPYWPGQDIFESINDPPITTKFKETALDSVPQGEDNIDIIGFFQCAHHVKCYTRTWAKKLFRFKQEWLEKFPKPEVRYVAAHVRRGEYLHRYSNKYAVLTHRSYEAAFMLYGVDRSLVRWVYTLTDKTPQKDVPWPNTWPYPAWTSSSPHAKMLPQALEFLPDFLMMIDADILFRANSTFSYWASVLADKQQQIFAPLVGELVGEHDIPFIRGNWPKCYKGYTDPVMYWR